MTQNAALFLAGRPCAYSAPCQRRRHNELKGPGTREVPPPPVGKTKLHCTACVLLFFLQIRGLVGDTETWESLYSCAPQDNVQVSNLSGGFYLSLVFAPGTTHKLGRFPILSRLAPSSLLSLSSLSPYLPLSLFAFLSPSVVLALHKLQLCALHAFHVLCLRLSGWEKNVIGAAVTQHTCSFASIASVRVVFYNIWVGLNTSHMYRPWWYIVLQGQVDFRPCVYRGHDTIV